MLTVGIMQCASFTNGVYGNCHVFPHAYAMALKLI